MLETNRIILTITNQRLLMPACSAVVDGQHELHLMKTQGPLLDSDSDVEKGHCHLCPEYTTYNIWHSTQGGQNSLDISQPPRKVCHCLTHIHFTEMQTFVDHIVLQTKHTVISLFLGGTVAQNTLTLPQHRQEVIAMPMLVLKWRLWFSLGLAHSVDSINMSSIVFHWAESSLT